MQKQEVNTLESGCYMDLIDSKGVGGALEVTIDDFHIDD
jgi:hypothetical protein